MLYVHYFVRVKDVFFYYVRVRVIFSVVLGLGLEICFHCMFVCCWLD